jgi:hypothetical protein
MKMRLALLFLILTINISIIGGQDLALGAKNWYIYNIGLDIGKNIKTKFTQLYSLDLPDYKLGFVQTDVLFAYRIFGKQYLKFEYSLGNYRWGPSLIEQGLRQDIFKTVSFNRLNLNYEITHGLSKKVKNLTLAHDVEAQVYFPQPEKHRARIVYNTTLRYSYKKSNTNLIAYIGTGMFYYLGGRPITYYNEDGTIAAHKAPNGLHRFRVKGGITLKPYKKIPFTLTVFAIQQWEFNSGLFPYSRLNYSRPIPISSISYPFNPADYNIVQPFNNYFTVGLSVNYIFKISGSKKDGQRDKTRTPEDIDNL